MVGGAFQTFCLFSPLFEEAVFSTSWATPSITIVEAHLVAGRESSS